MQILTLICLVMFVVVIIWVEEALFGKDGFVCTGPLWIIIFRHYILQQKVIKSKFKLLNVVSYTLNATSMECTRLCFIILLVAPLP